jgi:hypothetical protein
MTINPLTISNYRYGWLNGKTVDQYVKWSKIIWATALITGGLFCVSEIFIQFNKLGDIQ